MRKMTIEDFDEKFQPINNHIVGDESIFHFETYGEELDFVLKQDNNKIWTIVDGSSDSNMYLITGYHLVNRVGYVVCENAWIEDMEILYHEDLEEEEVC